MSVTHKGIGFLLNKHITSGIALNVPQGHLPTVIPQIYNHIANILLKNTLIKNSFKCIILYIGCMYMDIAWQLKKKILFHSRRYQSRSSPSQIPIFLPRIHVSSLWHGSFFPENLGHHVSICNGYN